MRQTSRGIPVKAALSATAVAGMLVLGPWAALPAVAAPVGHAQAAQATSAASDGVGETLAPMFGIGKTTITLEPQEGTFPADAPPDLNGLVVDITGPDDFANSCTVFASSTDPASCSTPLPVGEDLTITLDPGSTPPTGFLPPAPLTFNIPDCSPDDQQPTVCPEDVTVELPGAWRPVGLDVTNAATGNPVPDASYLLCDPDATSSADCPAGTGNVGDGTSGSDGNLTFDGIHLGGTYQVLATKVPAGYATPDSQSLQVPPITDVAHVLEEFVGDVQLTPLPPVATDDTASLPQNTSQQVAVLSNDTTPVGAVSLQSIGQPAHGKAVKGSNGEVTYTPDNGFVGTDSFSYTATNEYGGVDTATVTVTVKDVPPTLAPVHLGTDENTPVSFNAPGRASTPKGNTVRLKAVGTPRHGTATKGPNGKVTYTPDHNYVGKDSFSYTVADNHGGTATARVTVSVAAVTPAHRQQAAPKATQEVLPDTGAPHSALGVLAGLLVAFGSALVGWSRRRRQA